MYETHFNLREVPFSLTPDTDFFYNRESHSQALNTLVFALEQGEGFIKVVGEVGSGKTIICRKLLRTLSKKFKTAYIPNPYLTPEELKNLLAREIGAKVTTHMPAHRVLSAINNRLIKLAEHHQRVVMVIDEAQAMPRDTLEALRLLSNLETEKRKLVQIVLLGQPELDDLLNRDDLRQLRQRIVYQEYLRPFDRRTVRHYLRFRLAAAGYQQGSLFSGAAERLLYFASRGVPRLINILAHKAMISAWGRGDSKVTSYHVAKAITDTRESCYLGKLLSLRWHLLWPIAGATSLALVLIRPLWLGDMP